VEMPVSQRKVNDGDDEKNRQNVEKLKELKCLGQEFPSYICAIWQYSLIIKFFDIIVKFVDSICGMERRRSRSGIPQSGGLNLYFILP